ncbi:MAG: hypothetical protein KDJ80_10730 [Nitratireductor sp.]|nr:hypothetical protein [Nitratireductor sp.]
MGVNFYQGEVANRASPLPVAGRIEPENMEPGDGQAKSVDALRDALRNAFTADGITDFCCALLFEFPPQLMAEEAARGAAFLCQIDRQARLIFLAFGEDGGSVRLFEESEVPENLSDLGWSYARVLSHLPFARAGRWQIN